MKTKNLMATVLLAVVVLCSSKKINAQAFSVEKMSAKNTEIIQSKIYPNPSAGQMNIAVEDLPAGKVVIILTDLEGRELFSKTVEHENDGAFYTAIDADNFPDGMYKVRIIHANVVLVKKWTKG